MRSLTFSKRNAKEILRDPLNLCFGLGFPLVLIFLLSAIQANIPVPLFEIERLAPGIAVFGLAFMSLFSATLISKDRTSSFFKRLYTSPMKPSDFIIGYTLPIIPISVLQAAVSYVAALILGLDFSLNILLALVFVIPISLLYIGIGLFCGSLLTDKQVGGVCGALLTNLSAWLSGVWFDLETVGGAFASIANVLPFVHAVEIQKAIMMGDLSGIFPHIIWVIAYAAATLIFAVAVFLRQMKKQ